MYNRKNGHEDLADLHRLRREEDEEESATSEEKQKQSPVGRLTVSQPGDPDENEADVVSKKVMNGEAAEIQQTGAAVNRQGTGSPDVTPEFDEMLQKSKGSGQSLDNATRKEMESKMDADLGGIKIHTGSEAHHMSENINAKAFTHGQDVFFNQGEFNPTSRQGKTLLTHELVHTQQQQNAPATKIQRQAKGHQPGSDYTEGEMREDFELHEENLVDLMKQGDDAFYFKKGEKITFDGTKSAINEFWIYVSGTAYLRNQQAAGVPKSGWIRRTSTTMTLGLYEGVSIGDKSERLPVTTNSDAVLYEGTKHRIGKGEPYYTFKLMQKDNTTLYFASGQSVIVGDTEKGVIENGTTSFRWYEVEGTASYKNNPAKKEHMQGYVQATQLNLPKAPLDDAATGYSTLGNIGVNRPFEEVKTITLHQTDTDIDADPLSGVRSKINKPTNQFANYVIGGKGQISLITPVNEQISHNPGKNVTDTKIYDIAKPATPPATDQEKENLVKIVKVKTDNLYATGWMTKDTRDFWIAKSVDDPGVYPGQLYQALNDSGWNLFIKQADPTELTGNVNYNRTSIGIEVTGKPVQLPVIQAGEDVTTYRNKHITPLNLSPNYRAQLMSMTPDAFREYMRLTKYQIYEDVNEYQKYSSWKLVSAIAADKGLEMNAQTIVAHGETDQKNLSESVGNKEFIMAMIDYKATYNKIKTYVDAPNTLTTTQDGIYKEAGEILALIAGPQLTSGPDYDRVIAFFKDFYNNKKKLDDLAAELKLG